MSNPSYLEDAERREMTRLAWQSVLTRIIATREIWYWRILYTLASIGVYGSFWFY